MLKISLIKFFVKTKIILMKVNLLNEDVVLRPMKGGVQQWFRQFLNRRLSGACCMSCLDSGSAAGFGVVLCLKVWVYDLVGFLWVLGG